MKKILSSAMLLLAALTCGAQGVGVKIFEFEPFVGITYGLAGNTGDRKLGSALGLEARWNLRSNPLDIGAQLYLGSAVSRYDGQDLGCRTFAQTAFVDYNFNRGGTVSPFVGAGLSLNYYDMIEGNYNDYEGDGDRGLGFAPRAGVEFSRHLRLTLTAHLGKRIYDTVGLTVGYAFGGGRKRGL